MEYPNHDDPEDGRGQPGDDPDASHDAGIGERTDDLLTRAVAEALAAGTSWAQIGARLGVPPPAADDHGVVSDVAWQEAIVAHENERASRSGFGQTRAPHRGAD
ncbi:hypothetical protein [Rhodococcus wratislaviensis]|uniref:hypothetical protein n=1 Tax=Rhodococcus wratislaviensis TaxID=44752 RepID=UPI001CED760D|nr:hypothetical protein [Rhodococcus wratislaviensis]